MKFRMLFILSFFALNVMAQEEDLLSSLGEEETTNYATASFKTNRVINSHSLENTAAGVMDFKISHRFGSLNLSHPGMILNDFFGIDNALNVRIGFDYGLTNRLQIGIGRSSFGKSVDAYGKIKLLRQSKGKRNMPITASLFSSIYVSTLKWQFPDRENFFSSRLSFCNQLILGRKFSDNFSLQFMPSMVHRNLVPSPELENTVYAIGGACRQKLTKRMAINVEYYYVFPDQISPDLQNSLAIGIDIETGGHVFQLQFTNSSSMTEPGFITQTTDDFFKGDIHFGFNISRVFTLKKPKEIRSID
ncbi:MAG: DUF5777 family beta-barrel protein [Saprospiraceae bacterium]